MPVKDLSSPSFKPGEPSSEVWDDLDGVSSILDLIRSHDSRVVDNYILKIAKETPSIKTALVLPPIIYGKGQGPVKQRSVQIPALSKVAIERGHAVRAGRGLAAWTNVHVADLARLFTILAEKGAGGSEDENVWSEKGIYLPGVGELVSRVPSLHSIDEANYLDMGRYFGQSRQSSKGPGPHRYTGR